MPKTTKGFKGADGYIHDFYEWECGCWTEVAYEPFGSSQELIKAMICTKCFEGSLELLEELDKGRQLTLDLPSPEDGRPRGVDAN